MGNSYIVVLMSIWPNGVAFSFFLVFLLIFFLSPAIRLTSTSIVVGVEFHEFTVMVKKKLFKWKLSALNEWRFLCCPHDNSLQRSFKFTPFSTFLPWKVFHGYCGDLIINNLLELFTAQNYFFFLLNIILLVKLTCCSSLKLY